MTALSNIRTRTGNAIRNIGGTPWASLGRELPEGCTIDQALKLANMDWQALAAPATFARPDGTIGATGQKAIFRSDTGACLSVMGADYNVVQPRDVLEFFRSATENGGWRLKTAGTVRDGRKLWALAERADTAPTIVSKGDALASMLLLSTSLDGTSPTRAVPFVLRLICDNGMARSDSGVAVRVSHRSIFDPSIILNAMQAAGDDFAHFLNASQRMIDRPMSLDAAREVLRELFPSNSAKTREGTHATQGGDMLASAAASRRSVAAQASAQTSALLARIGANVAAKAPEVKDHRNIARILEMFQGDARGADLSSARGTAWGLFNAVTEHVDHEAGRTDDARLDSAWFGRGQALKNRALELLAA